MSQSFTNLLYHLIFSTKDRRPVITLDYQPRLYDYIGGIIRELGGVSLGNKRNRGPRSRRYETAS
jgi:hypothetical protein